MKDAYFAELGSTKVASGSNPAGEEVSTHTASGKEVEQAPKALKSKLKLKKKSQNEDPFASDDEANEKDERSKDLPSSKLNVARTAPKKRKSDDEQVEADERPKRKKKAQ